MTPEELAAVRTHHTTFEREWDHEYMSPEGPAAAAKSAEDVPALLAEVQRLRQVLAGIADYADERRAAIDDGVGLAQAALGAIVNTARQAVT